MVTDERYFPNSNTIIHPDTVAACPVAFSFSSVSLGSSRCSALFKVITANNGLYCFILTALRVTMWPINIVAATTLKTYI